ncbi:MAG: prepilin-type N-terminal cleavage/methylation domain-containing protein [Ruminococcus sp.]|nr:prepilin-type N-terminal cleavage/methylation domain-containing protein [Ruminococcus sp.]
MMRRQKGFTLIELVIIVAIIGILLGVLIPSWGYFLERGKVKSQNNKAKSVFNAAQTIITDLDFAERRYVLAYNKTGATDTEKGEALKHLYSQVPSVDTTREWYYYWDGTSGYRCDASGNRLTADNAGYTNGQFNSLQIDEWNEKIGKYIDKIVDDDIVYKIYVKDYKVKSVVSARFATDSYLGAYPTNTDMLDDLGADIDAIRMAHVDGALMTNFDLDTSEF